MLLGKLFDGIADSAAATEIVDLAYDSRQVTRGALFFCVPGFESDGHDFAQQAVAAGAAALVVERELEVDVPEVTVESVREAMPRAAARFYGEPTEDLEVIGVTGTNGKTTSAFIIRELLEFAGVQTGLLGTVMSVVGGERRAVVRTTAEAIELQRDFAEMLKGGDKVCAMEVSSHALELHRCDHTKFKVALFTNLTQDHLDFHETMEAYFEAKRRLFSLDVTTRVVNVDDEYGRRLSDEFKDAKTFAIERDADYRAVDIETGLTGSRFRLLTPDGEFAVSSPLPGYFNVLNVLGAYASCRALGVEPETLVAGLADAGRVPGRFEPVDVGQSFAVLVDYAHTPDSLENVLSAARNLTDGRVICVFGCGGDRDRGKRPLMGEIASRLADLAIVTSDNPRSEEPQAILDEIVTGMSNEPQAVVVDRREAIAQAISLAKSGDVVLIAGKGHEQGQEFSGGEKLPFDDRTVALEALEGARA